MIHDVANKKINDIKKDNSISRNRNYIFEFFSHVSDELKKDIINFAKSEKNLAIATDYLKVFPVVGKIHLYVNFPIDNETERASMLWHKDDFGYKSLDLFLNISICNENGTIAKMLVTKTLLAFSQEYGTTLSVLMFRQTD